MARIVKNKDILGGKPCIEGHRISVLHIWDVIESGGTVRDITETVYPYLTEDEVRTALRYIYENAEEVSEMKNERDEYREQFD